MGYGVTSWPRFSNLRMCLLTYKNINLLQLLIPANHKITDQSDFYSWFVIVWNSCRRSKISIALAFWQNSTRRNTDMKVYHNVYSRGTLFEFIVAYEGVIWVLHMEIGELLFIYMYSKVPIIRTVRRVIFADLAMYCRTGIHTVHIIGTLE